MSPSRSGDVDSGVAIVALTLPSGLEASELKPALADYVDDLPDTAVRSLSTDPTWVTAAGLEVVEPFGVLSGMAFAAFTKACALVGVPVLGSRREGAPRAS